MTSRFRAPVPLLLALALAGCDPDERGDTASAGDDTAAAAAAEPAASPAEPAAAVRTYPDLTRFDWYRQGEPLAIGGRGFEVRGRPVAAPADALELAGEYRGVEFYVPAGTDSPVETVYVPVFPGYWQPFVASGAEPALTD